LVPAADCPLTSGRVGRSGILMFILLGFDYINPMLWRLTCGEYRDGILVMLIVLGVGVGLCFTLMRLIHWCW
jgi:hypothetical protein